ncbi:MAG: PPC domain-containing protein [Anaerolineae bacterium]|nr:PPC domain-containing protein [Anaerolineae bacterium]
MTRYQTIYRPITLVLLVVVLALGLVLPSALRPMPVRAQGGAGQPITVGDIVTGQLSAQNFSQVYTLVASAGDTISLNVSTEIEELQLVVVVTDARGNLVVQDVDLGTPTTATIADAVLPVTGTYYVTVMRGSGATGDAAGTFRLQVTGFQQVGGQTVTLTNGGIVFDLIWNAAVDFNLEVRDPVGGTVHRNSPGSPSGGTLDADVNANCDAAIATEPTETVAWPAGTVPAGSYELIIYYTEACATGGPQLFTLNGQVNNDVAQSLIGTLNPGQQYLARLVVGVDGAWQLQNGGVNAGLDVTLFTNEITNADPIAVGSTVSGLITNSSPAQAYRFDATAGTNINIAVDAQSGSLDTYLALLGPGNTPVASNDDFEESTNSALSLGLLNDGTYTVLVTRYGLTIGGTEGEYNLRLSSTGTTAATTDTGNAGTTTDNTTLAPVPTATPANVLPGGEIEIKLEWATQADLQLLVRDTFGNTVYDDIPTVSSGGVLEEDGNVGCVDPVENPVSYIYWPANRKFPGTYEIEVWHQSSCDDLRVPNFGLTVNVSGQNIINLTPQPLTADQRYMITFTIGQDGTVTAGPGGVFSMEDPASLNYQAELAAATPITYGQTVSGSITEQTRFVVYAFEGQSGDIVTLSMNARVGGTLDPALFLITQEQLLVGFNDDVEPGKNPDSVIDKITLPSTGTYYIIATHYGLNFGGTTGTYDLMLLQD